MSRKDLVHKQNDLKCDPSYSEGLSKRGNFKASLGNLVNLSQKIGAKVMTQWLRALAVLLRNQGLAPSTQTVPSAITNSNYKKCSHSSGLHWHQACIWYIGMHAAKNPGT